ncbi:MAG: hypothetical protein ACRDTF_17690 [Pseudonocardiaceae bacterium]
MTAFSVESGNAKAAWADWPSLEVFTPVFPLCLCGAVRAVAGGVVMLAAGTSVPHRAG